LTPSTFTEQGQLNLISKTLHRTVNDILTMPATLTRLAESYRRQGYDVERRGPVVVLLLPGGEVHFCPAGRRIMQFIFKKGGNPLKLANFTLHDQAEHVDQWRSFGFEMDPAPRAPLIEFEKGEWTEEAILNAVHQALLDIRREGFQAILVGGLSNAMAYAWLLADALGLEVVMARTPRERTPDGKFIFHLAGYSRLLLPGL
jgi:hypothetical protein